MLILFVVKISALKFDSPLDAYEKQAEGLLAAHRAGDEEVFTLFLERHLRFLREDVPWEVCFGNEAVVRLLVERGARLDMKDKIYHSTPLGWAKHFENMEIAAFLEEKGKTSGKRPITNDERRM